MKAGDLKYRITIRKPVTETDELGQEVTESTRDLCTVWAGKWQLSTRDITKQAGQAAQAEAKFLIRHRTDITTDMTVLFDGKSYQITGHEDTEDRVGLYLFARSVHG